MTTITSSVFVSFYRNLKIGTFQRNTFSWSSDFILTVLDIHVTWVSQITLKLEFIYYFETLL